MQENLHNFQDNILTNLNTIKKQSNPALPKVFEKEASDSLKKKENYRTFGEVYLCNENTFGEFFRIQEFDTFDIEKFQGTEDRLFVFFRDTENNSQVAIIEKLVFVRLKPQFG